MASGSNNLTTYYAKRIIGDSAAASAASALLQTGDDITANTWIISRTNRATDYGIKYTYDATNGDKIEFYGGNPSAVKAWVMLDNGDVYILGHVGIGGNPETNGHQLYVYGTTKLLGNVGIGDDADLTNKLNVVGASYFDGNVTHNGIVYFANGTTYYIDNSAETYLGETKVDYLTINDTHQTDYRLYVNGTGFFSGFLTVKVNGESGIQICDGKHYNDNTFRAVLDLNPDNGNHGIWSSGYLNGTTFTNDGKWLLVRSNDGSVQMNGNALSATQVYVTNTGLPSSGNASYYLNFSDSVNSGNQDIRNTVMLYLWRNTNSNYLNIGNSNAIGALTLWNSGYNYNIATATLTAARTVTLPNSGGWIAVGGDGSSTGVGGQYAPVYLNSSGILTEITAGTTGQFYRGDKTWSNTIVGPFNASSSGTARANINMITVADQPNDFYLGNNNASKWSITSRASNESYNLNVYSTKSGIGYSTRWEYDTGKFLMLHGAEVSGGYLVISQPDDHRDYGLYGTYKYTKAATIWSMGTAYKIAADGSGLGSLYGAAYAYQDQAYIGSKKLAGGHQFVWCENGVPQVALGNTGVWLKKAGGIYWDPYVESASDASDVSRIIQVASGCAGGTELQIYQANDATDCINLVTPKSIYLNSKEAFNVSDSWLRINENKKFTSGVYFGSSLVRTDGTLRAGTGSGSWTDITAGVVVARIDSGESRVEARNGTHRVYLYCNSDGRSGLYGVRTDGTAHSLIAFANNSSTGTFYGNCTGNAATATNATNDSDGNKISTTYAKLSGAAFTGNCSITASAPSLAVKDSTKKVNVYLHAAADGTIGVYSDGYWNGSSKTSNGKWLIYRNNSNGTITVNGNCTGSSGSCTGNAATATKATQDGDGNTISSTYLKLSGGTMTGSIKFNKDAPLLFVYTASTETPMLVLNGAVNYGIRYKEGSPDTLKLSASGNANTDNADLCINGAGDGTVTIRGNTIIHTGNYTSWCAKASHTHDYRANTAPASGAWFRGTPTITSSGVMEIGRYIDFHSTNASTADYGYRLDCSADGQLVGSGTLALVNNSQNNSSYNAVLYIEHKSGNDWGAIINKNGASDYGLDVNCTSTGSYGIRCTGRITGTTVYGAVWNDYAEYRQGEIIEGGYCVHECSDGIMRKSTERLEAGCRVTSDTFGFAIGETEECKTPIATSGRVLVYPYRAREEYELGAAVCSAPDGTVDIMTREEIIQYPERIIGTVSEIPQYEIWECGEGKDDINNHKKVNGRIWIYVR